MIDASRPIAIIGCGLIGESWAALFLAHGYNVTAWDINAQVRDRFSAKVHRPLAQLKELGVNHPVGTLEVFDTLQSAVSGAQLVQETVSENVPLKRKLYAEIEEHVAEDVIISSSTSSLTWSELAAEMTHPERMITAHPFNPPHLMPLVEVFAKTPDTEAKATALYQSVGREVVMLKKDAVGHIANRLSSALWREAVNIVAEGIADVSAVDAALVHGPGLRWSVIGAHMAYHLGGGDGGIQHYLEHLGPSQEKRWSTLGHPKLTPDVCSLLVAGIEDAAGPRTIQDLEAARDQELIEILKCKRSQK